LGPPPRANPAKERGAAQPPAHSPAAARRDQRRGAGASLAGSVGRGPELGGGAGRRGGAAAGSARIKPGVPQLRAPQPLPGPSRRGASTPHRPRRDSWNAAESGGPAARLRPTQRKPGLARRYVPAEPAQCACVPSGLHQAGRAPTCTSASRLLGGFNLPTPATPRRAKSVSPSENVWFSIFDPEASLAREMSQRTPPT
jgi:hypothetical protein